MLQFVASRRSSVFMCKVAFPKVRRIENCGGCLACRFYFLNLLSLSFFLSATLYFEDLLRVSLVMVVTTCSCDGSSLPWLRVWVMTIMISLVSYRDGRKCMIVL